MKPEKLSLEELIRTDDPAWPVLRQQLADALRPAVLLPVDRARGEACLVALQAGLQSTLGAVGRYTAGLVVDNGWLRLLGAGGDRLAGLPEWNGLLGGAPVMPGALIVAHDALGGFYVVNGGALGQPAGTVHLRAVSAPGWIDLGVGYTRFVGAALSGELDVIYPGKRWPGWEAECRALPLDCALLFDPPLWEEPDTGLVPLVKRKRRILPMRAMWTVLDEVESARAPIEPEA